MSSQNFQNTPPTNIDNNCQYITVRNNKCKNKASENNKCTFHNNRLNKIINSGICKKISFEECNGFEFIKQVNENGKIKNVLKKCNDISIKTINNKHYCENHCTEYKYEIPEECVICSEPILYEEEVPLCCGHWFHLNCLKQCDKMQCPMCRNFYSDKEIKMIYDLTTIYFRENLNGGFYNFNLKIPKILMDDESLGITYIEILYIEITTFYKKLDLEYTSEIINKVLLNLFKNDEYLKVSIKVYQMFNKVKDGNLEGYMLKENINCDEDNEYTLNYDKFQDYIENMYHSV